MAHTPGPSHERLAPPLPVPGARVAVGDPATARASARGGEGGKRQAGSDTCAYEELLAPVDEACALQALLAAMPPGPYRRALAVQCGSGALALQLPAAEVVIADTSRPLLARAQKKAAQRRQRSRFSLWHGSLERLPRPAGDKKFDLIFVDGLRLAPPGPGRGAPLRGAIDAQLADGGVLLLLEHAAAPLPAFAYTPLETLPLQLGPWALQLTSYVR